VNLLSDINFTLTGIVELQQSLEKVMKKYHTLAEERLEECSENYKKRVIEITKESVNQQSAELIKGFELDKMRHYDNVMEKEFRCTTPQFNLIENGYNQVTKDGETIGWVPGYQIVKQASNEWEEELPKVTQQLITDIIKEFGL
jgi:hypothetical protein